MFQVARIIYVKNTKKFILKNSKLHVETCTYNIRQEYEAAGRRFIPGRGTNFFPLQCPFLLHYILVDNWFNLVEKSHKPVLFLGVGLIKYPTFNRQFLHRTHV
jgi:hypothetical protein